MRDTLSALQEAHEPDSRLGPNAKMPVRDDVVATGPTRLEDWLARGVDGLSARTVTLYRGTDPRNRTNRVLRDATTAVRAGPGTHHGAS